MVEKTPYEAGDPNSKILVLGQAPSFMEMRLGEPLVGPSGQVFNECLQKAGISRRDCYILNVWEDPVVTDKRTGNILSYTAGPELWKKKLTDLGLELAANTRERINKSGANVILALGQQALELVTGKHNKIMKWRGSPLLSSRLDYNRKVIATVHPAAVIQGQYIWKYLIQSDMVKVVHEATHGDLLLPERELIIEPDLDTIMDAFAECRRKGVIATDLEVINRHIACFCICPDPQHAVVVPFVDDTGNTWDFEDEVTIWKEYANIMGDPKVMKVNQNIVGFDSTFLLWRNHIMTRGPIGDTMIGYSILYPEFPKDLGFISSLYTREPYWKDEGKMWKDAGGDWHQFWRYNGKDGCVALECWKFIEEELRSLDMWNVYEWTVDMLEPVLFMTMHGLSIDKDALRDTEITLNTEIEKLEAELSHAAEQPFNPLSSQQCAKYFYGLKGIKPYIGPSGSPTTDDRALSRIFRKTGLIEAQLVQLIRNKRKLRSTYMEIQYDEDERLRCSWNLRGTYGGRFSSSQTIFGTGANLQNLDPRFKKFITDEPNYDFELRKL